MNKELATVLKNKLVNLPYMDLVAGMVQTVEEIKYNGEDKITVVSRNRFPVSVDVVRGPQFTGREIDLIPNSSRKSITYFEDYGSTINSTRDGLTEFTSTLRLVCWLNKKLLVGDDYAEITGYCIASIIPRLVTANPENIGVFTGLKTKALRIPIQSAELFSRYTYDENIRQYLRPPFEAFAIDLSCNYKVSSNCITQIPFKQ
jgi:hypothetical protein